MRFKNPHKYMETALGSCVELPSLRATPHTWAKSQNHEILRAQKKVSKGRPKTKQSVSASCVEWPSLNFHLVFFPADEAARERESERLGQLKKSGTPARKLGGLKKGQVTGWRQKVLYIIIYKLQPECWKLRSSCPHNPTVGTST